MKIFLRDDRAMKSIKGSSDGALLKPSASLCRFTHMLKFSDD